MANKTIGQLNSMTPSSTTELAIYDGSSTGKATVSDLLDTENLVYADDAQTPTSTDVDFESQDTSLTPSSTTSVDLLQGTDGWSQRFVKISQMFKNIRWLFSKLGSTDIASIGDGTLTGAISTLNSNTIKSILVTQRVYVFSSTAALNAHNGATLTNLGGTALVPNVPSGYTFLGNVNITLNGLVGVSAAFNGATQMTSQSVNPFIFNSSNNNISTGTSYTLRLYSLCYKN